MAKRVLLGFSGGADSMHSATRLRDEGYQVTAMHMVMTDADRDGVDTVRARAAELGIGFRTADLRESFQTEVTDYFVREYFAGRTPAPCTVCNPQIKWKTLYESALSEGYDHIATGHYFRRRTLGDKHFVCRPADLRKDQSHYLWMLPQQILSMALNPMDDVIKKDIMGAGTPRESMGICFLKGRDYRDFLIEQHRTRCLDYFLISQGDIEDRTGAVIGRHDGFPFYTTGQKKGLGLADGKCVVDIIPERNVLVAGEGNELFYRNLVLTGCTAPDERLLSDPALLSCMIRGYGVNPEGHCTVTTGKRQWLVQLENPAWAPAKGQPVVLYREDMVVGGGFLEDFY